MLYELGIKADLLQQKQHFPKGIAKAEIINRTEIVKGFGIAGVFAKA